MLLSLAGVSRKIIVADYAESQEQLWPLYKKIIAEVGGEENADFWLKPTATAEMMILTLDHLDNKYNDVTQYLISAAGLSSEEIDQLKTRLR